MTQEDKELLIKDLCARLPYRVWFKIGKNPIKIYDYVNDILKSIDIVNGMINDIYYIEDIKPYLFPISQKIKEQIEEYKHINHNEFMDYIAMDINIFYKGNDYLHQHHIDYRGLIEKGLAIDCTNLNIY